MKESCFKGMEENIKKMNVVFSNHISIEFIDGQYRIASIASTGGEIPYASISYNVKPEDFEKRLKKKFDKSIKRFIKKFEH